LKSNKEIEQQTGFDVKMKMLPIFFFIPATEFTTEVLIVLFVLGSKIITLLSSPEVAI